MPVLDEYKRVALSVIRIEREQRQRKEIEDLEGLAASIGKFGVLNPIIITKDYQLVAGERRYLASASIGMLDIPVRFVEDLSPSELKIIELEENIKRSDLGWRDLVSAMAEIHALHKSIDSEWTLTQTAEECNVGHPLVSMYLRVHEHFDDERIQQASTFNEAYNILKRRDARAAGDALMELIELPAAAQAPASATVDANGILVELPPAAPGAYAPTVIPKIVVPAAEKTILCENFLAWAPKYSGPKFNFIHCDFPYGIDVFSGPQGRGAEPTSGYSDQLGVYTTLLECLCSNLNQLMSISGHMMFWYSDKHRDITRRMFQKLAPSLEIHPYPLIWLKTDNAGIASDPRHGPRHVYETALFLTRGKRQIVRVVSDAYGAPTDKALHPSCKPEPMLKHFFGMLVDDSTTMLDPTCGSGSSVRAAEWHGAKLVLGLEQDPGFCDSARKALHMDRIKRAASGSNRAAGLL
jgi:ParB family transcriptional regulator, chromosome partitioning protein